MLAVIGFLDFDLELVILVIFSVLLHLLSFDFGYSLFSCILTGTSFFAELNDRFKNLSQHLNSFLKHVNSC